MEPSAVNRPRQESQGVRVELNHSEDTSKDVPRLPRQGVHPKREKASRSSQIRGVQILPSRREESNGRSNYRLHLAFDSVTDPSSLVRQTGTVSGVELEVEEKELQPLARLTGRQITVHYLLWAEDVEADSVLLENKQLREDVEHLQRKLRVVQDQLQYTVEAQVRDQRL